MKYVVMISTIALLLVTGVSAQQMRTAAGFLSATNRSGQMEIALANMAQNVGKSERVKAYAQMLASDHERAAQELGTLARSKNVTLMSDPGVSGVDPIVRLQHLKGHAFDVAYIDQMVRDHMQAIKDFQQAASSTDADVSAFATKTLPVLQKHLQEARAIRKEL